MNDVQRQMFSIMDKFRRLDFQSKILDIPKGEFRVLAVIMVRYLMDIILLRQSL